MKPLLLCISILCIQRTRSASAGQLYLHPISRNKCLGTRQTHLALYAGIASGRRSTCMLAVLSLPFDDLSAGGLPGRELALVWGHSSDWACQLLFQLVCIAQRQADTLKGYATCAKIAL